MPVLSEGSDDGAVQGTSFVALLLYTSVFTHFVSLRVQKKERRSHHRMLQHALANELLRLLQRHKVLGATDQIVLCVPDGYLACEASQRFSTYGPTKEM